MPQVMINPWRGVGILRDAPQPITDASAVAALLAQCPKHQETPLHRAPKLAARAGVAELWIKDERTRMGLGSFKALGAAFVIARDAVATGAADLHTALSARTYVTASAGNHGLSVAAGARVFGAQAVIYIAETVPEPFARRLAGTGARVVRNGADYEASMTAAADAAAREGWTLLSDSTWPGYTEPARGVMEGYLQLAAETVRQMHLPPTHILLQAGVGGMAAAVAAYARRAWGDAPHIIIVEPEAAPAVAKGNEIGGLVETEGPDSIMGRLDCKTASLVALSGLSRDADHYALISEVEAQAGVATLAEAGFATTPSGGAGLAALLAGLDLGPDARVLTILSEGPEDG